MQTETCLSEFIYFGHFRLLLVEIWFFSIKFASNIRNTAAFFSWLSSFYFTCHLTEDNTRAVAASQECLPIILNNIAFVYNIGLYARRISRSLSNPFSSRTVERELLRSVALIILAYVHSSVAACVWCCRFMVQRSTVRRRCSSSNLHQSVRIRTHNYATRWLLAEEVAQREYKVVQGIWEGHSSPTLIKTACIRLSLRMSVYIFLPQCRFVNWNWNTVTRTVKEILSHSRHFWM